MQRMSGMTLGAFVLGWALLGTGSAANRTESKRFTYTSSIQVQDHDRTGQRERYRGAQRKAVRLTNLAKIDLVQAAAAALAQVPGIVLQAELDNENGNLVYSVEILTSAQEIKEVQVDAGNGQVLRVEIDDDEDDEDEDD